MSGTQLVSPPAPGAGQTYALFPGNIIPASMLDPASQKILQTPMVPAQNWFLSSGVPQNNT